MRGRGLHATSLGSGAELPRNELIAALTPAEARALLYEWAFWARPNQLPPNGEWRVWLVLAGRGFGKTRTGAEMIRARVTARTAHRLALVAPTAGDARDVMVEGESGILAISPPWERPRYEPSKRRLTWPNGAVATLFSADEPERLRGPQHDAAWCDELASWRHPEAWDMLMFGLRLAPACKLRSEEHTSELQSHLNLVCRLLLEKKKTRAITPSKNQPTAAPDSAVIKH